MLELGDNWHGIDHDIRLVVSNQDVEILNLLYQDGVNAVLLENDLYELEEHVESLEVGTPYTIVRDGEEYTFYFTSLPLFFIEMDVPVMNYERRGALGIFSTTDGDIVKSDIGVNIRGGTSQEYPKKSFRVEFWADQTGETKRDFALLDLRTDDDWILLPMYNEPLRLRNASAHQLWEKLHQPYYHQEEQDARSGTRSRYIELFWNGVYRGVYLLTERIDRKQLQIDHYVVDEGMQSELYKGKDWGSGTVTFDFAGYYSNELRTWDGFEMKYPKEEMTTDWSSLFEFGKFIIQSTDSSFVSDVFQQFQVDNAIDYFIYFNLLYGADNIGKNTFIARQKNDDPYFYVPWDLDGVFGNNWKGSRIGYTENILSNGLYDRLLDNCLPTSFGDMVLERWSQFRTTILNTDSLSYLLKGHHDFLLENGVYQREELAWPEFEYSYSDFTYATNWVNHRANQLDQLFSDLCSPSLSVTSKSSDAFILFPNPSNGNLAFYHKSLPEGTDYIIRNTLGKIVRKGELQRHTTYLDIDEVPAGIYFFTITTASDSFTLRWVKQ